VLMIRMLLVGYIFAIRSERQICSEVQVNLAYRWFCKLTIEDGIPDHSVFCRARHERFRESNALRRVFEGVVATCIAAGLVGGEAFSVDASLIKADVDKTRRVPGDQPIVWPKAEEISRAVREYLAALDAAHNNEEKGDSGNSRGGDSRRKALTSTGNIDQGHIVYYRASKRDCSACLLKPKCTTAVARKLTRDVDEDIRAHVRALARTEAFQQSRCERKTVEMRFAHMKRILRLDRLRLRGLSGVRDEVLLTATAQNLKRLVKLLGRAPPSSAITCPG